MKYKYTVEIVSDYSKREYYLFKFLLVPEIEVYKIEIEVETVLEEGKYEYRKKISMREFQNQGVHDNRIHTFTSLTSAIATARIWSIQAVFAFEHDKSPQQQVLEAHVNIEDFPTIEKLFKEKFSISFLGSNLEKLFV